jgi:hypothetical protein
MQVALSCYDHRVPVPHPVLDSTSGPLLLRQLDAVECSILAASGPSTPRCLQHRYALRTSCVLSPARQAPSRAAMTNAQRPASTVVSAFVCPAPHPPARPRLRRFVEAPLAPIETALSYALAPACSRIALTYSPLTATRLSRISSRSPRLRACTPPARRPHPHSAEATGHVQFHQRCHLCQAREGACRALDFGRPRRGLIR